MTLGHVMLFWWAGLWGGPTAAADAGPGPSCGTTSQQRLPCPPLTSTRLHQAGLPGRTGTPYLIKVQNSEEVPGVLLGNLDSFLCGHTAVTCQAVAQKYLGIGQLMELSLLGKKDAVWAGPSARGSQGESSTGTVHDTDPEHPRRRRAGLALQWLEDTATVTDTSESRR